METAITSSVNWFQPRSIDIKDNLLVYVSRNTLFCYTIQEDGHIEFEKTITGHQVAVNACRLCHALPPGSNQILLATCDDYGFVRIWNVITSTILKIYQTHGKSKVNCLDWSKVNKDLIVTVDEKGLMVVYHYSENKAIKFFPENSANCLQMVTCSPFNENLVCVGYKTGSVSVVDIKGRCSVVMKFRGHNSEIQDIYWPNIMFSGEDFNTITANSDQWHPHSKSNPKKPNQSPPTPSQEYTNKNQYNSEWNSDIIVTCCKDKNIRLWCAKDGKFIRMLRTPGRVFQGKRPNDEYSRLFLNVYWSPKHKFKLLSTGYNGEMIVWDLAKPFKDKLQMTAVGASDIDSCHKRAVTTLCPGPNPDTVISASVDRTVKCWMDVFDKPNDRPTWTLPTVGGYIHKIQVCPIDPTLVAFGGGDGTIRVWQTSNPHDRYDMITCYQKIREKISSIAWHPTLADVIGFATEDGKVGCFNVNTPGQAVLSSTYHLKVVYCLGWGPRCYRKDGGAQRNTAMCLYSAAGDGVLLMHHSSIATNRPPQPNRDDQHWSERAVTAIRVNNLIKDTNKDFDERYRQYAVTEFAWNHNYKFLAIGDYRGSILIFSAPHMQQLIEISSVYRYMINALAWAPPMDEKSPFWLASGSKEELVAVFDLHAQLSTFDNDADNDKEVVVITKATRSLVGHKSRITSVSWSPRQAGLLASGSFDGTVQIWNVYQDIPIANCRKHTSRVLTVCWTQIRTKNGEGEEMLFSGGEDYSLHSWCYSKLDQKLPPKEIPPWCLHQGHYKKLITKQRKSDRDKVKDSGIVEVMNDETQDISLLLATKKDQLLASLNELQPLASPREAAAAEAKVDQVLKVFLESTVSDGRNLFASGLKNHEKIKGDKLIAKNVMEDPQFVHTSSKRNRPRTILKLSCKNEEDLPLLCDNLKNTLLTRIKEKDQRNGMRTPSPQVVEQQQNSEEGESSESVPPQQENVESFLYGSRKSMMNALEDEEDNLLTNHSLKTSFHPYHLFESYAAIKLWKGQVVDLIDEAIAQKKLNDQLVNYAVTVSYDLWLKTVKAFAEQLYEHNYYLRSSNYYVACNMIEKAVKTLIDGLLFREALALARIRFGDESEITKHAASFFYCRETTHAKASIPVLSAVSLIGGDIDASTQRLHDGMYRNNKARKENCVELNLEYGILSLVTCRLDDDVTAKKLVSYTNDCLNECGGYDIRWKTVHQTAEKFGLYALSFRLIISAHELLVNILNMTDDEKLSYFANNYEKQASPWFEKRTKTDSFNDQYQAILSSLVKVDGYDDEKVVKVLMDDMKKLIEHSNTLYDDNLTFRHVLVQLSVCLAAANLHRFCKLKKCENEEEDEIKNLLIKFTKHQAFVKELRENALDIYNGVEHTKTYTDRIPVATVQQVSSQLKETSTAAVPKTPAETEASPVETPASTETSAETSTTAVPKTPAETEASPAETPASTETSAETSLEAEPEIPAEETPTEKAEETPSKTPPETPKASENGSENGNRKYETKDDGEDESKQTNGDHCKPHIKGNVTFSDETDHSVQPCGQTLGSSVSTESSTKEGTDVSTSEKPAQLNGVSNGEEVIKSNGTTTDMNGHHNGGLHKEYVPTEILEAVGDVVTGTSGRIINPGCKLNNGEETNGATATTTKSSVLCQQN